MTLFYLLFIFFIDNEMKRLTIMIDRSYNISIAIMYDIAIFHWFRRSTSTTSFAFTFNTNHYL